MVRRQCRSRDAPRRSTGGENSAFYSEAGRCAVCGEPLPPRSGPGRPREYCSPGCKDVADAVKRLAQAVDRVAPRSVCRVRRYVVAEALNRLPLDRAMLSERAASQRRDEGGRFA